MLVIVYMQKKSNAGPVLAMMSLIAVGRSSAVVVFAGIVDGFSKERGIEYQELSEVAREILMSAIYQGVKAFDKDYACLQGEELFELLSNTSWNSAFDCVIAGCTEIPILLDWLQVSSQISSIQRFLTKVVVINPVISAFRWISNGEEV